MNKKVVEVNHLANTASTVGDEALPPTAFDPSLEEKRAAVLSAVSEYLLKHFAGGRAACGAFAKEGELTVVISGDKLNLKNYWGGSWVSTWTVGSDGCLSGVAKLRAHYFEEGNVQLHTTKEFPAVKVTGGDFGKAVAAMISDREQELQQALATMYMNMSNETLKSMRRVMPKTQKKMEWNMQAHKMVKQLHTK